MCLAFPPHAAQNSTATKTKTKTKTTKKQGEQRREGPQPIILPKPNIGQLVGYYFICTLHRNSKHTHGMFALPRCERVCWLAAGVVLFYIRLLFGEMRLQRCSTTHPPIHPSIIFDVHQHGLYAVCLFMAASRSGRSPTLGVTDDG